MLLKLHNIEFENPIHFFHVSNTKFDKPCINTINNVRDKRDTHDNSVLGLWVSTYPNMCSSFGNHTYQFKLKDNTTFKGILLEEFFRLCTRGNNGDKLSLEQYNHLRNEWMKTTDVIFILDASQGINEVIILNLDVIDDFTHITDIPKDKHYSLKKVT